MTKKVKKRYFVLMVFLVMMVLALSLGAFAFQNEPEGFRGLLWGDPPTEDMEFFFDLGKGTLTYQLPDEKMFLGSVSLYSIGYAFYENQFTWAAMYFKGEDNYDVLETICRERFGEEEVDEGYYEMNWKGQKSFIMLSYDSLEETGILSLNSTLIGREETEATKKKEAKKAEGDW